MFIVSNDVIQPLRTNIFLYFALLYPLSLLCPFSFFVSPSLSFHVFAALSFKFFAALPFFLLLYMHIISPSLSFYITPSLNSRSQHHSLSSLSFTISVPSLSLSLSVFLSPFYISLSLFSTFSVSPLSLLLNIFIGLEIILSPNTIVLYLPHALSLTPPHSQSPLCFKI